MSASQADIVVAPPFQDLTGDQEARIRAAAGGQSIQFVAPKEFEAAAAGAVVVACRHGHGMGFLSHAPRLKWIHSWSAGVDEMAGPEVAASGAVVTCAKSNGAIALAEHSLMLMLMLERKAIQWIDAQRRKEWEKHPIGELHGRTCGFVGLGYIGKETAARAKAFGMRTLGLKRTREPVANIDEMFGRDDLHAMLAQCDFVHISAPYTAETDNMFDADTLAAMKPGSYLVLVSRGGIVDEDAVVAALKSGHLGGVALDDFAIEPLPSSSPLWDAPNILLTPHNGPSTSGTLNRGIDIFIDNLERWQAGKGLRNVVDLEAGY